MYRKLLFDCLRHSCCPNAFVAEETLPRKECLVASCDPSITLPEDSAAITVDFSTLHISDGWQGFAHCTCAAPKCRRIITRFEYLLFPIQKGYFDSKTLPPDAVTAYAQLRDLEMPPPRDIEKLFTDGGSDSIVIRQLAPPGVEVRACPYGMAMYSTAPFRIGETIYMGRNYEIPNKFATWTLSIYPTGSVRRNAATDCLELDLRVTPQQCMQDTATHTVEFTPTRRWLFIFDGHMNHACDPTVYSNPLRPEVPGQEEGGILVYDTKALKDLRGGEEITCDYNVFEYDCKEKGIPKCFCGAPACIGAVRGFRFLTKPQRVARLPFVDDAVLEEMNEDEAGDTQWVPMTKALADNPNVAATQEPPGPGMCTTKIRMTARVNIEEGQTIFSAPRFELREGTNYVIPSFANGRFLTEIPPMPQFSYFFVKALDKETVNAAVSGTEKDLFELRALTNILAGSDIRYR